MLIPLDIRLPEMALVAQRVPGPRLEHPLAAVRAALAGLQPETRMTRGMRIAVTAGSRGITGIAELLAVVVEELKLRGAEPFIVPAMGSHGGATAEGQVSVLRTLGVTEQSVGCPIRASMDTIPLGETPDGVPVFLDRHAAEADGIVVVNRIKAHTDFSGPVESGMMKMMTIGLGKHRGALAAHRYAVRSGYAVVVVAVAREVIRRAPVLFGLGLIENAYDQTAEVAAVWPEAIEETEKAMLLRAKALMSRLPFQQLDLLVVDEIGKEISGAGMDPNVIGRMPDVSGPQSPAIARIVVRDLSDRSYGNGIGIGMADFTTQRFADKFDPRPTYINGLTSAAPDKARLPVIAGSDREAIEWALMTIGPIDPQQARIARIQNTLHMERLYASEALWNEIAANPMLEVIGDRGPMRFDDGGWLAPARVLD